MVFVVYSPIDPVSVNAAEAMKSLLKFEDADPIGGMKHLKCGNIDFIELNTIHLYADFLDDYIKNDTIIFLSRHGSIKNIAAFTVHPEGNWTNEAKLGGKPNELAVSSPIQMAKVLHAMKKNNKSDIPVIYEATHHGPLLNTPSLYAEIGGTQEIRDSKDHANFLAKSVADSVDQEISYDKVAVGLGGLHYADRFAKLTIENKYIFSHIMPRHYIENVDMIKQGVERSVPKAEIGIIDWKSLKAEQREKVIGKLNELGLDYEKI
jgi:D-aminoacyl-tRNA deacylase